MPTKTFRVTRLVTLVLLVASLISCSRGVSGTYTGTGDSFFERLAFKSGNKVDITFAGMTAEGTYESNGNQVKISRGEDTRVLVVGDNGCLIGDRLVGVYCKSGSSAAGRAGDGPLLGIYQAGNDEDGITLNFQRGNKVVVTLSGEPLSSNGYYERSGNQIKVTVPGGKPINLVNKGNVLESSMNGQTVEFVKR